jgi:hypothetical protein
VRPKSTRLDRFSSRLGTLHVAIAVLVVLVASIWVGQGGLLHPESVNFLAAHLSDRPMWSLIFDSRVLDNGTYQARELSYLLDRIDCFFIAYSTALGFPHFLSLIHYTFSFLSSMLAWLLLVRYFRLDRLLSLLLVLMFVTSPTLFLESFYLRSAKIGVTLMVAIIALDLARVFAMSPEQQEKQNWMRRGSVFLLLCLLMTLLDRQGFFFAVLLTLFFALRCFLSFSRANLTYLSASAAACLISNAYNHWIAPAICRALNGYTPTMEYQKIPWDRLWTEAGDLIPNGALLFINEFRYFAGDLPIGVALCLCVSMAIVIARYQRLPDPSGTPLLQWQRKWFSIAIVPLFLLTLIAMNSIMYLWHKRIALEDIQRLYYWTPQTLVTMILAGLALSILQRNGLSLNLARIALGVLLFSNIVALPAHWKLVRYGHHVDSYALGALYRTNLKNIGEPGMIQPDVGRTPTFVAIEKRALAFRSFFGMGAR